MFYHIEDSYVVDEGSGNEDEFSSSDEEEDSFGLMLAAMLGEKSGPKKKIASDLDDFEKEMNDELNSTMKKIQMGKQPNNQTTENTSSQVASTSTPQNASSKRFYEDVYFDSDEEDDEEPVPNKGPKGKQRKKHPVISDDDLFYDPNMDQDDQDWIDKRRQSHLPRNRNPAAVKRPPQSDAVLNCPACMTTLCDDCQRHDIYRNQYRAMFVFNCTVDLEKYLQYKPKNKQDKLKKKVEKSESKAESVGGPSVPEFYHPVHCSVCKTQVAVYDKEEVYHFFNVLVGYS